MSLTVTTADGTPVPLGGANSSAAGATLAQRLQLQTAVTVTAAVRRDGGSYSGTQAFQFLVGAGVILWLYSSVMLGPGAQCRPRLQLAYSDARSARAADVFAYVAANPEADVSPRSRTARACAVLSPWMPAAAMLGDALLGVLNFAAANAAAGVASQLPDCSSRHRFCALARAATAMAFFATACLVPTHRAAARARRRQRDDQGATLSAPSAAAPEAVQVGPATVAPLQLPPPLASPRANGLQMT